MATKTKTDPRIAQVKAANIFPGAQDLHVAIYIKQCDLCGVDPLSGLLVPMLDKKGGRVRYIATIDLLRARAAASGEYAGNDDAEFAHEETAGKKDATAKVVVWRIVQGQRVPFSATARWSEYNAGGRMWQKMPRTMLGKCAEALALRKGFPAELAGMYAKEEMDQADTDDAPVQQTKPDTSNAKAVIQEAKTQERQGPAEPQEEALEDPIHAELVGLHNKLGTDICKRAKRHWDGDDRAELRDRLTAISAFVEAVPDWQTEGKRSDLKELTNHDHPADVPPDLLTDALGHFVTDRAS